MTTAAVIVSRALRLIQVVDANEAPEAEDFRDACIALNALGVRWATSGLISAWQTVEGPETLISTPAAADEALTYSLAVRMASEYGRPISPEVAALAESAAAVLWRDRLTAPGAGTVAAIIYRALRALSGQGVAKYPDGFNLSGALYALDSLGSRWRRSGLITAWTTPAAIDAPYSNGAEAIDAFVHNLALRLAAEYGVPIRQELPVLAQEGVAALWRDRLEATGSGTVGSVIRRALRLVRTPGGLPDTATMSGAIEALNAMVRLWEVDGLSIGWSDVSTITEQLPAPPEAEDVLAHNLALALAPEYGADVRPDVVARAASGLSTLSAQVQANSYDRLSYGDLPCGVGRRGGSYIDGING